MEGGICPAAGAGAGRAAGGLPESAAGTTDVCRDAKRGAGKRRLAAGLAGANGYEGQEQSAQNQLDRAAQEVGGLGQDAEDGENSGLRVFGSGGVQQRRARGAKKGFPCAAGGAGTGS